MSRAFVLFFVLITLPLFVFLGHVAGSVAREMAKSSKQSGVHLDPAVYPWVGAVAMTVIGGFVVYVLGLYVVSAIQTFAQIGLCLSEVEEQLKNSVSHRQLKG
ncbi:MAG: hypothetical protein HUU18_04165 [Phycisphaerales bacterium]|nr:hypothetical protein [Phycisphaerales bacterium]